MQALIITAFIAFILFTSNPFERLFPAPPDGTGLNPLLQDPGLAIHPPFLYLGYVGFSIPFSFAVAALVLGKADSVWGRLVRPWALAAWTFLTIGIALGSWWAYYELGWGGWWAWDPVENASFMPWLAGTALIHSVRVVERRDALERLGHSPRHRDVFAQSRRHIPGALRRFDVRTCICRRSGAGRFHSSHSGSGDWRRAESRDPRYSL